ncbi:hypothetical protein [Endozoicomonas sp. 2B-B]
MQAISGTSWKATTSSSDTADISNDDKSVCVICQVEFDKKIVVDSYGYAFNSDQRQCDKCIGVRKITSATQVTLEAAIRDGDFSLAHRLVNDHGAILTADILKVGLESAAKTLNVQQARSLFELSSSEPATQAVARTVLDGVLQKALASAKATTSLHMHRNTVEFTRLFFNHDIVNNELANIALYICVLKDDLESAQEFKTKYRAQLEATHFQTVLRQIVQELEEGICLQKGKTDILLDLVTPDAATQTIAQDILTHFLQNALPQAVNMSWLKYSGIKEFTDLILSHHLGNIELANMALEICVLRGELESALKFKTEHRAQLGVTTFQKVLQQMDLKSDTNRIDILLSLVMPDEAAQTIVLDMLTGLLQNALTEFENMSDPVYRDIMAFTHIVFRHEIINSALVNTALRICILREETEQAQKIKALYGAFVFEKEYGMHTIESFAEKIGYKLTTDRAKDYRNMARMIHPDKQQSSDELMKELNRLYDK